MITSQSIKQLNSFVVSTDTNKAFKASRASDSDGVKTTHSYYNRIIKQCKKLSQLVAISWLEHEKARQIRQIFLDFKSNDFERQSPTYIDMVHLLTGKKGDLLEPWFPDNSFGAIFDQEEIDYYLIQVKWDTLKGVSKKFLNLLLNKKDLTLSWYCPILLNPVPRILIYIIPRKNWKNG